MKHEKRDKPRHLVMYDDATPVAKKRSVVVTILIVVFSAVFLVSAGVLVFELIVNPYVADRNTEEIQSVFSEAMASEESAVSTEPDAQSPETDKADAKAQDDTRRVKAVQALQAVNADIGGWLRIENTNINYPVLVPPEDDPEYYLYRNYKKEDSKYGSIFLGAGTSLKSPLLHGHSMQDGRMFWSLISFGNPEMVKKSPVIQFDTYEEAGDWKIVSVFKTNTHSGQGKLFAYTKVPADEDTTSGKREKMQFYYEIMKRSMVDTGVDLHEDDRILLLSTCSYEYEGFRTVVVARKVREGEDAAVDTSKIKENENALFPDVWYASGKAPSYWPEKFEDALAAGLIDWYSGDLYD